MARVESCQVLIVGAGPGGIAAACAAAGCGADVLLIDDNAAPGGQIWRGKESPRSDVSARRWLRRLEGSGARRLHSTTVLMPTGTCELLAEDDQGTLTLRYDKLIVATGARELFLPFPGWTLPGVFGAGGLQAMAKCGLHVRGRRIVVAGTGPLLLAVASYLRGCGADVVMVAEQAPRSRVACFGLSLLRQPGKLLQAMGLRMKLWPMPYRTGWWITEAQGDGRLEAVTVTDGRRHECVACDFLGCGFGLVPNIELGVLLGCRVLNGAVLVDEYSRTSVANVFAAGEVTGIGGAEQALIQGTIAGLVACGRDVEARRWLGKLRRARAFAIQLASAFALRDELRDLPRSDTVVCRCEDVSHGALKAHGAWREAKLLTRCGMGPCQGRICGPACSFLFRWEAPTVRPPLFPTSLAVLAGD